eukprot:1215570-Pyramimonas_sp.AAC.1
MKINNYAVFWEKFEALLQKFKMPCPDLFDVLLSGDRFVGGLKRPCVVLLGSLSLSLPLARLLARRLRPSPSRPLTVLPLHPLSKETTE